jgi:nitrogen fixation protein NifB
MYPNKDTPFEGLGEPGKKVMEVIQERAGLYLPQMKHCTRCRADAVGLLGEDRSNEFHSCLTACARLPLDLGDRPHVAVATMEGVLVNQHLGEARKFQIWSKSEEAFRCIEERTAPEPGDGPARWKRLAEILGDCRAVLIAGIGENPRNILMASGINPIEMNGFIHSGLEAVYSGRSAKEFKVRRSGGCSKGVGCSGTGDGC